MKYAIRPVLLCILLLWSCTNNHKEKVSEAGDANTDDPSYSLDQVEQKSQPVFTASELPYPFSSAVQVGDVLYLSGEIGVVDNGTELVPGGLEAETHQMFGRIKSTLEKHGLGLEDVFKCTVMLADMSEWPAFNAIYAGYFEPGQYPTRSAMGVNGLALGARVEMECWAYMPRND